MELERQGESLARWAASRGQARQIRHEILCGVHDHHYDDDETYRVPRMCVGCLLVELHNDAVYEDDPNALQALSELASLTQSHFEGAVEDIFTRDIIRSLDS